MTGICLGYSIHTILYRLQMIAQRGPGRPFTFAGRHRAGPSDDSPARRVRGLQSHPCRPGRAGRTTSLDSLDRLNVPERACGAMGRDQPGWAGRESYTAAAALWHAGICRAGSGSLERYRFNLAIQIWCCASDRRVVVRWAR